MLLVHLIVLLAMTYSAANPGPARRALAYAHPIALDMRGGSTQDAHPDLTIEGALHA